MLVLSRRVRALFPRRLRAEMDDYACSPDELLGRPGVITPFRFEDRHIEANVCCPGCGNQVVYIDGAEHVLRQTGDGLHCDEVMHFQVCCGWRGRLTRGWWVGK